MATVAEPGTANGRVKLGLALSGGGFRASFFHLGVLAQMAMQGLLRRVEVISAVSGGSIIGALYYLHVKRLLESAADSDLTDGHYQQMVERIERDFFAAVQTNIRMSTFADPAANYRLRQPDCSRSDRLAELYNDRLYQGVLPGLQPPIKIREVKIQPKGTNAGFHPEDDNHGRSAKVPILLVNATTLNSGRNWRFTASRMGEPPRDNALAREIDKKEIRLRRPPSYSDIPPHQQDFTLGHAVAASACVPGIFPPLAISGLYRDPETGGEIRVQLVDGGVHDNQGIQGLLDEDCTHFIVSDASRQMDEKPEPATHFDAVLGRAVAISQDRLREEQLFRLWGPTDRSCIAFMHLRAGLTTRAIAWLGLDGQAAAPLQEVLRPSISAADFHVDDRVQDLISGIRTDLDSFTEVEACTLMADGYLMSDSELNSLAAAVTGRPGGNARPAHLGPPAWGFLKIKPWMERPNEAYLKHLKVASFQFFKLFNLLLPRWAKEALAVLAGLALLGLAWILLDVMISVGLVLLGVILWGLNHYSPKLGRAVRVFRALRAPVETIVRFIARALIPMLGSWAVNFHLKYIDPIFLRYGQIERLPPPGP
ncbi:MAG: patatin-like phospholipase family protein [Pseudomonadota bacterium]|nr:patatin-like phospholipase family protein [Pseudomonadota bacterium]